MPEEDASTKDKKRRRSIVSLIRWAKLLRRKLWNECHSINKKENFHWLNLNTMTTQRPDIFKSEQAVWCPRNLIFPRTVCNTSCFKSWFWASPPCFLKSRTVCLINCIVCCLYDVNLVQETLNTRNTWLVWSIIMWTSWKTFLLFSPVFPAVLCRSWRYSPAPSLYSPTAWPEGRQRNSRKVKNYRPV